MINLIYITGKPEVAEFVLNNGADLVMVDIEVLGKHERQAGRNTWISNHTDLDVRRVIERVGPDQVIVRTDPLHAESVGQLDGILGAGAKHLMLPMYHTESDVVEYQAIVGGRASVVPLAETTGAIECFDAVTSRDDIQRIHIGLNDLQLSSGTHFLFEPIVTGLLGELAAVAAANGTAFGFGGVARVGEGLIPAELILAEHIRINSSAVILSRTFRKGDGTDDEEARSKTFSDAVAQLKACEAELRALEPSQLEARRRDAIRLISAEVDRRKLAARESDEARA